MVNRLFLDWWAIIWCKNNLSFTSLGKDIVLRLILITICVTSYYNRRSPTWNNKWNVFYNNRLTENCSVKSIPNLTVWWLPHLFQSKLFNSRLIRSNSCTFYSNFVLEHSIEAVSCDLVVSSVTVLNWEIVVVRLQVNVGEYVLK